jgi:hypothetical protein
MLTLPHPAQDLSAIGAIKQWWQPWILLCGRFTRPASVPTDPENSLAQRQSVARFSMAFDLLLMRMEALRLDPSEVERIETGVFRDLITACRDCECKDECERDLAYLSVGRTTEDWETYCPNAAVLNAMKEMPWFGNRPPGAC